MKKSILVLFAALALSGCAAVQKQTLCTEAWREAIVAEDKRLNDSRQVIEGYAAGQPIRGMVHSSLMHPEMVRAYKQSYNRALDMHEQRAAEFNRYCVAK